MSKLYYTHIISNLITKITLEAYPLQLRTAFGTSHSSTSHRTNALVSIQIGKTIGYGETGLPPKKPLCYLANYEDIEAYFHEFNKTLSAVNDRAFYDPFHALDAKFFKDIRNGSTEPLPVHVIRVIFKALDTCPANEESYSFAARCGIEMALLDLWGKVLNKPLFSLIGIDEPLNKPAFYTAALNPDISLIVEAARFGYKHTPYLKIKLDGDVQKGIEIVTRLHHEFQKLSLQKKWSIDANSAWTPEIAMEFLEFLKREPYKSTIYMLEQPFPVDLTKGQEISKEALSQWAEVKAAYEQHDIMVFADESVSTAADIEKLSTVIHGINIKLEKAGGIRGALAAASAAKAQGLKVWFGCMVSSRLSCTASAHLLSLSEYGGDLDGALLVEEASQLFEGGFSWKKPESVYSTEYGVAEFPKDIVGLGLQFKTLAK